MENHGAILLEERIDMNLKNLAGEVHSSMYHQVQKRGYAASVDVLMDLGILSKADYENWRNGRVDYLERVCKINLKRLADINHYMRVYAEKDGLKPSVTVYKKWGKPSRFPDGTIRPLRFSKSRNPNIEKWYATHFVDPNFKKRKEADKAEKEGVVEAAEESGKERIAKEAEKERIAKEAPEKKVPAPKKEKAAKPAQPKQGHAKPQNAQQGQPKPVKTKAQQPKPQNAKQGQSKPQKAKTPQEAQPKKKKG